MAGEKGKSGIIKGSITDHASSHFIAEGGDGRTAGSEGSLFAQIGGIGDSEVLFSASWDWGHAPAPIGPGDVGYDGTRHPCALVDINPQVLIFDFIDFGNPWTSTAEVTITHKSGAVIEANITGGSVCEITVFGSLQSINEWNINFEVVGGTKRFIDAAGSGTIHFFFDSSNGTFGINEVLVHMD